MTPQERDLLSNLVSRLRQSPPQQRESEADAMIADLIRERPDAPYVLARTVLIQDYSLHQAQARIAELERQAQGAQAQPESGGFLGAIFGSSKPPQQQPQPQPAYQQPQPAAQQAQGPWGPAPAQQVFAQPSFLRSAATTAAGIAGGALLFQGIESLLGGRGGFGYGPASYGGGLMTQPGLTETTINNYYENPQAPDTTQADFQPGDVDSSGGGVTDADFDTGGGFDGGGDFGGTDV